MSTMSDLDDRGDPDLTELWQPIGVETVICLAALLAARSAFDNRRTRCSVIGQQATDPSRPAASKLLRAVRGPLSDHRHRLFRRLRNAHRHGRGRPMCVELSLRREQGIQRAPDRVHCGPQLAISTAATAGSSDPQGNRRGPSLRLGASHGCAAEWLLGHGGRHLKRRWPNHRLEGHRTRPPGGGNRNSQTRRRARPLQPPLGQRRPNIGQLPATVLRMTPSFVLTTMTRDFVRACHHVLNYRDEMTRATSTWKMLT